LQLFGLIVKKNGRIDLIAIDFTDKHLTNNKYAKVVLVNHGGH